MAFTVGNVAAKDGAGATIGGGLLAADIAGSGVGPWFLYNGLVDGIAGSNKAAVTTLNALRVDAAAVAHDAVATSVNPTLVGGYASAAAPAAVSTDGDSVRAWLLLNGAQATVLTAAGALIGGDATNGLDVDVTRMPGQFTEDVAAAADPIGNMMMAVRRDTLTASEVSADGDNIAIKATNKGQVHTYAQIDTTQLATLLTSQSTFSTGAQQVSIPSDHPGIAVLGSVAHDGVDAGAPVKVGMRAIAFGTNPTAVAAADRTDLYANRAGVPFMIGGHPNIVAKAHRVLASDGAQTDLGLTTVGSGAKIVITQLWVKAAKANSGNVAVKIGFGTANVPTPALAGVAGLLIDEVVGAGEGHQVGNGSGIVAVGADAEDLRITCDSPTAGNLTIGYSYHTIES